MAALRRTLSPAPRPGSIPSGEACLGSSPLSRSSLSEACLVASPLSRSSLSPHNYQTPINLPPSSFTWFDYLFYQVQGFILGLFMRRSSRPLERQKPKGQVWKRSLLHYVLCFTIGVFYGLAPFASIQSPMDIISKHHAFSFKVVQAHKRNVTILSDSSYVNATSKFIPIKTELGIRNDTYANIVGNQSQNGDLDIEIRKLLIVVTPTHNRPFQAHYLNRLAHTIKSIPPPLLWIVVDMESQSAETAKILRGNGVMYRHLVCNKNLSDVTSRSVNQRNVALSHIETHRLDGIVYFADDDNIYSVDIFESMRQIRRFGTWVVAKPADSSTRVTLEGPICNGTQIIGWHTNGETIQSQRFYAEFSGFAFNSTMLWDQKRWHRPTLKLVRQLDTIREAQVSKFIEQLVEDESQMECLDLSKIMVWHLYVESIFPYSPELLIKNKNLDITIPLSSKF